MNRIEGLNEYIKRKEYRKALGLPSEVSEVYEFLAQGEYNVNYKFTHPVTRQELLLRVNCGSQMKLKNQIGYEYNALKFLKKSGRTPEPLYVDGSKQYLDQGVLIMNYLEGNSLNYETDFMLAAEILADIHSMHVSNASFLLSPTNPLEAILVECRQMLQIYFDSPLADRNKIEIILELLEIGSTMVKEQNLYKGYQCCINTELNSTNFLINKEGGPNYLIDWEKPLKGEPAQDLGHFLAPTTTFWKTDIILERKQMELFLDYYIKCVNGRFDISGVRERVDIFIPITCLRGISWCAMAWVQYQQPGKLIRNESTWKKLEQYLDINFLQKIKETYFDNAKVNK